MLSVEISVYRRRWWTGKKFITVFRHYMKAVPEIGHLLHVDRDDDTLKGIRDLRVMLVSHALSGTNGHDIRMIAEWVDEHGHNV